MFYEELMMDPQTLIKFKLFRRMLTLQNPNHPIAQLAKEMALSYQQTFIELTEIDQDLNELNPEQLSILGRGGKLQPQNIAATIDEYRFYLLNKSVPFLYVLYMLNEENPTITDFCKKHDVSRSTVSRKFENLKNHLKQFQLRFTYTESNLVGDERLVRLSLFNIIWLGVRGIQWPFAVSETEAEAFVDDFATYFPISRSYLGKLELKYFAALVLLRIKKENFAKYDRRYNFLMKNNSYYDFNRLGPLLTTRTELTEKQLKGESSFIYLLSQMLPFYVSEEDRSLKQTLAFYTNKQNPIYPLVTDFLEQMKQTYFEEQPELLDDPVLIGNLINAAFGNYIFRQPFPNIYRLLNPSMDHGLPQEQLQKHIEEFFIIYRATTGVEYVNDTNQEQIAAMFTHFLLPAYDKIRYSNRLHVGVVLEDNFLLVQSLNQFLQDLTFVQADPFDPQVMDSYDLVISSNQLMKKMNPTMATYLWDYAAADSQYIDLYRTLKKHFNEKNQHV
jgi:hypothetical protein